MNDIDTHLHLNCTFDGNVDRNSIRKVIEEYIAALKDRPWIPFHDAKAVYDPVTGYTDLYLTPTPTIQGIDLSSVRSSVDPEIDFVEQYNATPGIASVSHSYTPSEPNQRITTMYDAVDAILVKTSNMLDDARHKPVTEDLMVSLMERFAGFILEAHGIDKAVDIHAIEMRPKENV